MKKFIAILLALVMCCGVFTGCEERQADMVSYNLSLEADNFNNVRQIAGSVGTLNLTERRTK